MTSPSFHHAVILQKQAHYAPEIADIDTCVNELRTFLQQNAIGSDLMSDEAALEAVAHKTQADLAIAVGGDGTMLALMAALAGSGIPGVGINMGRLGFLTDISQRSLIDDMQQLVNGQFLRESRFLLQYEFAPKSGKGALEGRGLNDVVIHKPSGRLIEYQIRIDGTFVTSTRSDGLIISTPTGSTAYALSAGGPIVHPELPAFVIVPICPHTLSNRPVIVSANSTIEIIIEPDSSSDARSRLLCDGKNITALNAYDRVFIRNAQESAEFLRLEGHDYYMGLRSKLGWAGRPPQ